MARNFGGERATSNHQRYCDLEEGSTLLDLSTGCQDDETPTNKDASVVTARSSIDGSISGLSEFAEFSRPRRRRSWWKRLLMSVRPRRRFRTIEERGTLFPSTSIRKRHVSVKASGICLGLIVVALAVFGIIHIWNYVIGLAPFFWDDGVDYWLPNWGKHGEAGEGLARYPTDFTRDVLPIPCHSHNDYWRRIPLLEALHYGCTGVEADLWLFDEELYVGHNTASLTRNRTFRSLYLDPLVDILGTQNPQTEFSNSTRNGVFDEDPSQTLILLVDFKNDGQAIWPYVQEQLSTLRERNYLTYYDGSKVVLGPITVVGTGNTPFDMLTANSTYRDIFFDAPLSRMWQKPDNRPPSELLSDAFDAITGNKGKGQGLVGVSSTTTFDSTNSYYASVNFKKTIGILWRGQLNDKQMELIRGHIQGAHARGLKVRYWNTPNWPIGLRNHIWHVLVQEGADMLNVDDLRSAARRDWRRKGQRRKDS